MSKKNNDTAWEERQAEPVAEQAIPPAVRARRVYEDSSQLQDDYLRWGGGGSGDDGGGGDIGRRDQHPDFPGRKQQQHEQLRQLQLELQQQQQLELQQRRRRPRDGGNLPPTADADTDADADADVSAAAFAGRTGGVSLYSTGVSGTRREREDGGDGGGGGGGGGGGFTAMDDGGVYRGNRPSPSRHFSMTRNTPTLRINPSGMLPLGGGATPRFAPPGGGGGGAGGAFGGRDWGPQWPSSSSATRLDSAGSHARSARRKNKGMGQGPLSSISRDVGRRHFWTGATTPVSAAAYSRTAQSFARQKKSTSETRGSLGSAAPPPPVSGINRGFERGFFDSMSSASGSFCSSGCLAPSLGERGFGGSGRYFGVSGSGTAENNLGSARRGRGSRDGYAWRNQPDLAVVDMGSRYRFSSSSSSAGHAGVGGGWARGGGGGGGKVMAAAAKATQPSAPSPSVAGGDDSVTPALPPENSGGASAVGPVHGPRSNSSNSTSRSAGEKPSRRGLDQDSMKSAEDGAGVGSGVDLDGQASRRSSASMLSDLPVPAVVSSASAAGPNPGGQQQQQQQQHQNKHERERRHSRKSGRFSSGSRSTVSGVSNDGNAPAEAAPGAARDYVVGGGYEGEPRMTAAQLAEVRRQQERARALEAEAEWRSALPARLEALAELAAVEHVGEAPSDLRKAWTWYDRPGVAKMLNDVADSMAATGFHNEAADLFDRSVKIYTWYAGPDAHLGIAEALNELGYVLWDACANPVFVGQDVAEDLACALMANAEEVFWLALSEARSYPGQGHPFAATCFSNLADCASARLAHEEASALCRWALQVQQECLGPKHLNTADTLRKLGGLVHRQGLLEEAEIIYMHALEVFAEVLGPDHEDVGSALNLLAVVVGEQGRYLEAENYHRQALGQRRRAGANGPHDLAPFCYNLALVVGTNARKGPLDKLREGEQESEALLTEALMIYQQGLPPDHPEIADCMDKLAGAVAMNGDLSRAEVLHREALSIMERTLPPDDPRIAEVLFNLSAVVGGQRGRLGETENILHRCLEAQKRLHGLGHPEVSLILDKLADVIRARDAASICPSSSKEHGHSGGASSYHHSLTASRRNGMSQQSWWDTRSSVTSRGSSWFGSGPNARPSPLNMAGGGGSGAVDSGESQQGLGSGGGGRGGWGENVGAPGGIAGIGRDGAIPEEESGVLAAGGGGWGGTHERLSGGVEGNVKGSDHVAREGGAQAEFGGNINADADATVTAGGGVDTDSWRPPKPKPAAAATAAAVASVAAAAADDGMRGEIRVGMRFVAASPMNSAGGRRRSYRGGKMASFFDMYSRGNSRRGQSDSSSSISSLNTGVGEGDGGSNRGEKSKATPIRRNPRRGGAATGGAAAASLRRSGPGGRSSSGSGMVRKSSSRVSERGGGGSGSGKVRKSSSRVSERGGGGSGSGKVRKSSSRVSERGGGGSGSGKVRKSSSRVSERGGGVSGSGRVRKSSSRVSERGGRVGGSDRVRKSSSRVSERSGGGGGGSGGGGGGGSGSGKIKLVGDEGGGGRKSMRGLEAVRRKGSSAGGSSGRRSRSDLGLDIPRPRPISYPSSTHAKAAKRGSGRVAGGSGSIAGLVRGESRGSVRDKGKVQGGGGKVSSTSAKPPQSPANSYSAGDGTSLSELSSSSSDSEYSSDDSWSSSSPLASSPTRGRPGGSSGSLSGDDDDYTSIGDVPSLHGHEVVRSAGLSAYDHQHQHQHQHHQHQDGNTNAFAVNSEHSDHSGAEYPRAANCWSDGVFETSGDSSPAKSGSKSHATAAAAAAAAGAAAASLLTAAQQDSPTSAATLAALVPPPFQVASADMLPTAVSSKPRTSLSAGTDGGESGATAIPAAATTTATDAATAPVSTTALTQPLADNEEEGNNPTDQVGGSIFRRRAKAFGGSFRRRGASQKSAPYDTTTVPGNSGDVGQGEGPSNAPPVEPMGRHPDDQVLPVSGAAHEHLELELPPNVMNRNDEGEGMRFQRTVAGEREAAAAGSDMAPRSARISTTTTSAREVPGAPGAVPGRQTSERVSSRGDPPRDGGDAPPTEVVGVDVSRGTTEGGGGERSDGAPSADATALDMTVRGPDKSDEKGTTDAKGGGGDGGDPGRRRGSTGRKSVGGVLAAALSKVSGGRKEGKIDRRSSTSSSAKKGGGEGGGAGAGAGGGARAGAGGAARAGPGEVQGGRAAPGSPGSDGDPPGMEALQFKWMGGKGWSRGGGGGGGGSAKKKAAASSKKNDESAGTSI